MPLRSLPGEAAEQKARWTGRIFCKQTNGSYLPFKNRGLSLFFQPNRFNKQLWQYKNSVTLPPPTPGETR